MQLNTANGHITIESLSISPTLSIPDVESLGGIYGIKKGFQNKQYVSYLIPEIANGEVALLLLFFNSKLASVSIELGKKYNYPPFKITADERRVIAYKLEQIGGANIYGWGKVNIVEDSKGGTISIVVKYNQ